MLMAASFAMAQNATETPTIRQNVRLVSIDVLVMDKDGRAVPGLLPEDFSVTENGVTQKVLHAEPHVVAGASDGRDVHAARGSSIVPLMDAGKASYSNRLPGGEAVWNVILLDVLNTSPNDQMQARRDLWKFVKTLPPDQPIALATMSDSLHVLTPFQAGASGLDKLLATAIANPRSSMLLDVYNPDDQAIMEHIQAKMPDHGAAQQTSIQSEETRRTELRVQEALSNFGSLAAWLGAYPGRKNVFWLSTGFPLITVPHAFASDKGPGTQAENFRGRHSAEQNEVGKSLQLARVAIFPIDIRGVLGDYAGMTDATHNSGLYVGPAGAHALVADMNNASTEQSEELLEEKQIAEDTGGIAKFNSNDIAGMMRSAYDASQSYYTVSYSPANKEWKGEYRRTDVSVAKKGYRLTYRRGYYAVDRPVTAPTTDDFTRALRKGAPPARDVLFTATLKRDSQLIALDYSVDVHTLKFAGDGEVRTAGVDCAVVEYDRLGKVLGTAQIHVDGKVKQGDWSRLEQTGFPAHQVLPQAANVTSITIGIRDHATGEFGNMEVALAR
jgi:VWFA-related protein